MKKIKIGFLATIAALAMSFTLAEDTGVLDHTPLSTSKLEVCTTADYGAAQIGSTNYWNPDKIVPESCNPSNPTTDCPGHEEVFMGTLLCPLVEETQCNGGNFFCCAKSTGVPGQIEVFCKAE